jgi:hypothetical protein
MPMSPSEQVAAGEGFWWILENFAASLDYPAFDLPTVLPFLANDIEGDGRSFPPVLQEKL